MRRTVAKASKSPGAFAGIANSAGRFAGMRHTVAKASKRSRTVREASKRSRTVREASKPSLCVMGTEALTHPRAPLCVIATRIASVLYNGKICTNERKVAMQLKVALVHDWLVSNSGSERVLLDLHELWPDAPIYTLVYDEQNAPEWTHSCDVRTTFLQKIPGATHRYKMLLSLMPKAWEAIDLLEYDLVVSSCMSCCKGVITRPDALHVCYCHSPIRYVWDRYYEYLEGTDPIRRLAMRRIIPKVRQWDYLAAQRVDEFVANSDFVSNRIRKYYRRDSVTIHPASPVRAGEVCEPDDCYLVVSRFVGYKRVDLAIEACNRLGRRLVVVSSGGEEEKNLREMAGPTIEFRRAVTDDELVGLYAHAKAFLFPGVEDFGLTPVEAMSAGVPVLAFGEGGTLETVVSGKTGLFFEEQSVASLADCIQRFERGGVALSRSEIAQYGRSFSRERFRERFGSFVAQKLEEYGVGRPRIAMAGTCPATDEHPAPASTRPATDERPAPASTRPAPAGDAPKSGSANKRVANAAQ